MPRSWARPAPNRIRWTAWTLPPWSVLPRTLLDDQVRRLPLPGIQLERRLGYILHTERTHSNAAQAFMGLLDEVERE